jgi:hypothetical protein
MHNGMGGHANHGSYAHHHTQPQGQYQQQPGYYPGAGAPPRSQTAAPNPQPAASSIDEMMKDVEKKAMWKEIEELRAKVAKYEKGE